MYLHILITLIKFTLVTLIKLFKLKYRCNVRNSIPEHTRAPFSLYCFINR